MYGIISYRLFRGRLSKELAFYYVGSIVASISPFFINSTEGKVAEIIGLSILTIQVARHKQYNLVLLNLASITGFLVSIFVTNGS